MYNSGLLDDKMINTFDRKFSVREINHPPGLCQWKIKSLANSTQTRLCASPLLPMDGSSSGKMNEGSLSLLRQTFLHGPVAGARTLTRVLRMDRTLAGEKKG